MNNRTDELQECYLRRVPVAERNFRYVGPDGRPYRDRRGLARIASFAVPPGWTDVFVSPDPDEELQALCRMLRSRARRSKCAATCDEDRRPCCQTRAMRAARMRRNFAVRAALPAG